MTAIRNAIREERELNTCIINYKKGGAPFVNLFHISPVRECPGGQVAFYAWVMTEARAPQRPPRPESSRPPPPAARRPPHARRRS